VVAEVLLANFIAPRGEGGEVAGLKSAHFNSTTSAP